jgi:hypothetical protein
VIRCKTKKYKEFYMKKFAFWVVFGFLVVSLFAQQYDKILQGDLSDFAGDWVNGQGFRVQLRANGTLAVKSRPYEFKKWGAAYVWAVGYDDEPGHGIILFPVGVDVSYDAAGTVIVKTDKTRVRLHMGQDGPSNPEEIYYRESEFPGTHITSENLRLRTDQNLNSTTIKILEKGARVQVQKWGNDVTINGNKAKWAYVITIDGLAGWCYSGYLRELQE